MSLDIEAIRARANAATAGPWIRVPQRGTGDMIAREYDTGKQMSPRGLRLICSMLMRGNSRKQDQANSEFIANARADIPDLLNEIERLTQVLRDLVEVCDHGDGEAYTNALAELAKGADK
jgi:hypothetical protein